MSRPFKILLIENDEDDFMFLKDVLRDTSYLEFDLDWVKTYDLGVEAIRRAEHDAVLLDYRLGNRNGLQLLREVTANGCSVPIILLTGEGDYGVDKEAMDAGAADCLPKDRLSSDLLERSIRRGMERQRERADLLKAKRVVQALSECNHSVLHIKDETELLHAICRIAVDVGGYRMAWVGYAEDDSNQTVTPVARYGYEKDYLETVKVTWKDVERGRGPTGTCIRSGSPGIIRFVGTQAEFAPWKVEALKRGYASVIGLPLFLDGRRLGALTIYASEADAFDTEEVEFLIKLSNNLSYGIEVLRLRKVRVQTEELLREANLDLERRVEQRSAELVRINDQLRREVKKHKQTEEALRESKEFVEKIVNSIGDPLLVLDRQHQYVLANDAMCSFFGRKREDVIGRTDYDLLPEKQVDIYWGEDELLFETGKENEDERKITDIKGIVRTVVTKKTPYTDQARNKFIVGVIRDISERKRAEEFARMRLALFEFAISHSLEELLQKTLDEVGKLTNSPIGFYHFIENDQRTISLQAWSTQTVKTLCKADGKGTHYPIDRAGVWADCVRERRAVIHNKYAALSHRKGMPEGHVEVIRELVVPIIKSDRIVAILGIGNKPANYTQTDVEIVSFLADVAWEIAEHKRMENALRDSEAMLRQIIDLVPHKIFVKDWDGKYLLVNKAVAESYRKSVNDLIGKHHADFHPNESELLGMLRDDREVIARGETKLIPEEPYTDAQGNLHFMQTTKVPFHLPGHKKAAVLGIAIDITNIKRAREVLRESEAKYRLISENTGDVIWQYDINTDQFIYASPSVHRLTGFTPEETLGQNMEAVLTRESMRYVTKRLPEIITALNAGDESVRVTTHELDQLRKDGSVVPIEVVTTLLQDTAGRVDRIIGVSRDITEKRRAAEALKESETKYRTLFETMTEGVALHEIIYDEQGKAVDYRITSTNPAFEKQTGLKPEQVIGQLAGKIFGPDQAPFLERYAQVANSGEPDSFETYCPVVNGFFHISVTSPKRGCFVTVLENITERKQAEDALRESQQKLADIIDFLPDATFVIDGEGKIIAWNKAMEEMMGISASAMLGKGDYEYAVPLYGERRPTLIDLVFEPDEAAAAGYLTLEIKDTVLLAETYLPNHKGRETYLFCTASALYDSRGHIIGAIESVRDITERKLMEKAVAEAEAKYRDIFENSVTGIFQTTPEGRFLSVNGSITAMLGYDSNEELLDSIIDVSQLYVHPEQRSEMLRLIEEQGWVREFEAECFRKDKTVIWVSFNIRAVRRSTGEIGYLEGTVSDITDGKFLRAQLEQAQRMEAIGTLAGGIAHDFNNILTPIIGYTELSLNIVSEDVRLARNMKQVLISANRAKDLVRQILSFSRKAKQEQKSVQVSPLLKEIIKLLRSSLPSTIAIRQSLHPDAFDSATMADPTQIHQVLMNLCTNAAHAMHDKGGTLTISLQNVDIGAQAGGGIPEMEPGPYLRLSVADTGHGMDEATKKRIFDPYFTTKGPDEGTGLGLAVVYGIVKDLSGAITVWSKPGKGTTFDVYFPRTETVQPPATELSRPLPTGHGRLLVVDDERFIVEMVKEMLETLGYDVVGRQGSMDALEAFRAEPESFDLVITDMTMPHMTGIDLATKILTIRPQIPIILCTGFNDTVDENKIKLLGIRELLMKPVALRDMAEIVNKILRKDGR